MPVGQALLAGTEGAAFGFFPILWIVINAIWVYNLTVATGHFDVLRRSFEKVSPDQRIQAIIIAFCFGALLEALAGFGTPVAITVVMLMALGFQPIKAAVGRAGRQHRAGRVRRAGHPDRHAGHGHLGRQRRPRLDRRHARRDGRPADPDPRGLRAAGPGVHRRRPARRPADLAAGARLRRRLRASPSSSPSNYISVPLTDIVAVAASRRPRSCCCSGSGSRPRSRGPPAEAQVAGAAGVAAGAAARRSAAAAARAAGRGAGDAEPRRRDRSTAAADVAARLRAVPRHHRDLLDHQHHRGQGRPGQGAVDLRLRLARARRRSTPRASRSPSTDVHVQLAARGRHADDHRRASSPRSILQVTPGARRCAAYGETYVELQLGDRHGDGGARPRLRDEPVRPDRHRSAPGWPAPAASFALLSPILGWLGVAVTGSDTSSNALFGALQVQTAGAGRPRPGADGRRELLRRRARQDGQPAEPRHRRGGRRHGRPGGRHLPQGDRLEPGVPRVHVRARHLQSTPVLDWMVPDRPPQRRRCRSRRWPTRIISPRAMTKNATIAARVAGIP